MGINHEFDKTSVKMHINSHKGYIPHKQWAMCKRILSSPLSLPVEGILTVQRGY